MISEFHTDPSGDTRFRGIERRFLRTLLAGFGLVLVAMVASGVMGLRAMKRIDREASALSERYLRETSLIDQLARQQASLGVLLYSMADEHTHSGLVRLAGELGVQFEQTRQVVRRALENEANPAEMDAWRAVEQAADPLFREIQELVARRRNNSVALSMLYRDFTTATARVLEASYKDAADLRTAQLTLDAGVLQSARNLFLLALAMAGFCAAASVLGSVASFHRIEKQAKTLSRLSLHTLAQQEDSARRFSQEMHDEFGQTLNAIGSTLAVVQAKDPDCQRRLQDAVGLVREAQSTARELSQLLRPRILDDFGLDAGLRELSRGFSERTGIVVDYRSQVRERLAPLVETHLFRITQESLTNTARHTVASHVEIMLERHGDCISLTVSDNGGGFPTEPGSRGLGLLGMRERAQAVGGKLTIRSLANQGVTVHASIPLNNHELMNRLPQLRPAGESQG